jgi:hypothetical protein
LLLVSYRLKTKWIHKNGELTEECQSILKQFKYLYSFEKADDSDLMEVIGTASDEKFQQDLTPYPELAEALRYTQIIPCDDSDSRSGDKVEPNLVDILLLPFDLYPVTVQTIKGVGEGALGAHLVL